MLFNDFEFGNLSGDISGCVKKNIDNQDIDCYFFDNEDISDNIGDGFNDTGDDFNNIEDNSSNIEDDFIDMEDGSDNVEDEIMLLFELLLGTGWVDDTGGDLEKYIDGQYNEIDIENPIIEDPNVENSIIQDSVIQDDSLTPQEELALAWENLNDSEISGIKRYKGVTINVLVFSGTFPEGTYLEIEPITTDNIYDIKNQIDDENENISLDSDLIAFDISFWYELRNGDIVKLQPYTGKTVQVTFDYSDNEDFEYEDTDIKIYHVENKNEEITQNRSKKVQEVEINREISNKARGLLSIDAKSFSIYVLAIRSVNNDMTVHYDAVDGYFSGDESVLDVVYTKSGDVYVPDINIQQPDKTGFTFAGWYTDSGTLENRWFGVNSDTESGVTVYAKYLEFSDSVFNFGGASFTIMDRNLGATTGDISSVGSYGYKYQWGNNFGFGDNEAVSMDSNLVVNNNDIVRGPGNYFSNGVFITRTASPYRWESVQNDNLWGGISGSQLDTQGPCPRGYHIPSTGEWNAVYALYIKSGGTARNFSSTLGLPFAGYRYYTNASNSSLGDIAYYWTNNVYNQNVAYTYYFTIDTTPSIKNDIYRTYGNPVRCFKNTDQVTITFDSNGGSNVNDQNFYWWEARTSAKKPISTRDGKDFAGWFIDSGLTTEFVWANNTYVSEDITLYAKWGCDAGYVFSGGVCVLRNVTVNYMVGDELYKTMKYDRNKTGQYLPTTTNFFIPQKSGNWMFDQWYLDTGFTQLWMFPMDDDGLGENVTVYAHFLPFGDLTLTLSGNTFTIMDRNLGAIEVFNGNNFSTGTVGYYYQYGNNYGFPNLGTWVNTTVYQVTNPISTSWSYTNPYSNGLFVKRTNNSAWLTNSYNSLRSSSTTAKISLDTSKIGPCPTGYHIPESAEWAYVRNSFLKWKATSDGIAYCQGYTNGTCFAKLLGLPMGGYMDRSTTAIQQGGTGYYHSTTYYTTNEFYRFMFNNSTYTNTYTYSYGYPVRCFKNTDRYVLTFDAQGGTTPVTQYIWWWSPYTTATSTRYGSVFSGRYLDTGYSTQFTGAVNQSMTVYAKWNCKDGFVMNEDNGECETDSRIHITFVANPTSFPGGHFSDGTTQKTIEYKGMSAGYFAAVEEEIQVPQLDSNGETGYMFEGWYVDTGFAITSRWTGLSANTTYETITLYARFLPFRDKVITWDVGKMTYNFTIMDRNLGALDFSSGYSYSNSQSTAYGSDNIRTRIGNYYQRGNNFGFPNRTHTAGKNGTTDAYPNNVLNIFVENISGRIRGPGNYYFNGIFVRRSQSPWYRNLGSKSYENLWGGGGTNYTNSADNPDIDRQGPCPDGYHVPDTREWLVARNLFQKWAVTSAGANYCDTIDNGSHTGINYCMPAALGLPFAGYRSYSSAGVVYRGTYGYYWSSTAYSAVNAYYLYFDSSSLTPQNGSNRAYAFSVRCFKNSPALTLSFDSNGGSSVTSQGGKRRWEKTYNSAPKAPTRANSTFVGWFVDAGLTEAFSRSSTTYITQNTTLYAKWRCNAGYNQSTDGQRCEPATTVTFNASANGGSTSIPVAGFYPGDIVDLSKYTATKAGWTFVGRNTTETAHTAMDSLEIGSNNVTVFAIFTRNLTATFDPNGNDSQTFGGTTTTGFILQSCTIRNNSTDCEVLSPTINSVNTPNILGYSTGANLHTGTYGVNSTVKLYDDVRLYAQTQTNKIDRLITFNPNGNISFVYDTTYFSAQSFVFCTILPTFNGELQGDTCSSTIDFPDIVPSSGNVVLGWSTSSNSIDDLIQTGARKSFTLSGNITYYAQSQSDGKNFTATFYGNGAVISGAFTQQVGCTIDPTLNGGIQATECTVEVPSITRNNGFTILGYNTDENAHTASIPVSATGVSISGNVSFYAITYKHVQVDFRANGNDSLFLSGVGEVGSGSYLTELCTIRNNSLVCSIVTPTINSVNTPQILGYSTSSGNHTSMSCNHNSVINVSHNSVYYAQSKKETGYVNILFYINGNSGYTYEGVTYTGNSSHILCEKPAVFNGELQDEFCSSGKTFPTILAPIKTPTVLGRSDSNTNHDVSFSGGEFAILTVSGDISFFAQTTSGAIILTGSFSKGTGIQSISSTTGFCTIPAIYNGNGGGDQNDSCIMSFPEFIIQSGYQNPLWLSILGSQNATTTKSTSITGYTSFVLRASPKDYQISYNLGGGTQTQPKITYNIEDNDFVLVNPTKKGYTFAGWTGSNGNTPEISVTVSKGTYGNLEYFANWTPIDYTITYHLNGGMLSGENRTGYSVETDTFSVINPSKTGYTFVGWTGTNISNSSPRLNLSIYKGTVGNLEFFAKWIANEYLITFLDGDGNEIQTGLISYGTMPNYVGDTPSKIPTAQYSYIFKGWSPEIVPVVGTATYQAQFESTINIYQLLFLDEDGNTIVYSGVYAYGTPSSSISVPNPSKASDGLYQYEFSGWSPEITDVVANAEYLATYISKPIPQISFETPTPENNGVVTGNRFTTKINISNIDYIKSLIYEYNDVNYDLMSGLILMYNFDNLSSLGESGTIVRDLSHNGNDGIVYGATWIDNGKHGGAYDFDGIDDYISFSGLVSLQNSSIVLWIKTGDNRTNIALVNGESYYINGHSGSVVNMGIDINNGYIGRIGNNYFDGKIDEIYIFNRELTLDEIRFLYKSNLKKTSETTWNFETINTCLNNSGQYFFSGYVVSFLDTSNVTGRVLVSNIPSVSVSGTGYDFGTHEVTGGNYTLSGTMGTMTVTDMVGNNGWMVYISTSPTLQGKYTNESIDTDNLIFKANNLMYNGYYDWSLNTHVKFGNGISNVEYTTAKGNLSGGNILEYMVRSSDSNDFLCEDVGFYSDNTDIRLDVPAWQVEDTYEGTLWITLQQD